VDPQQGRNRDEFCVVAVGAGAAGSIEVEYEDDFGWNDCIAGSGGL
jgi:hypothetical protein